MTIGAELRAIRDNAIKDTKQKIKDWFDEHMNELKGAALGGTDCIVYNNEETFAYYGIDFKIYGTWNLCTECRY